MIKFIIAVIFLLVNSTAHAQSAVDAGHLSSLETRRTKPIIEAQCGMSLETPSLKSVSEQTIGFGCINSYKNGGRAVMEMSFEYDPNFNPRGGDRITFEIEEVGIERKIVEKSDSVFQLKAEEDLPTLAPNSAYKASNCNDPVIKTKVLALHGSNWHGWIAEETFAKSHGRCRPAKEYTSRYRCVHVMVGNEKMVAQLDGVCLLRKRKLSLENGFSYDLFMNMLKSIRFNEGVK